MTIRRRYYLSLLMVLVLFGANLFAYFWSARMRHYAESEWDKATACELKLSSIRQELDNLNKHFVLASQIRQEDSTAVGATETGDFEKSISATQDEIESLREAASPDQLPAIKDFIQSYRGLTATWMAFYGNIGKDEAEAVRSLLDPLLRALEMLLFVSRNLHPPDFEELMASVGTPDEELKSALARPLQWPQRPPDIGTLLGAACDAALGAFAGLRKTLQQSGDVRDVYRALRRGFVF